MEDNKIYDYNGGGEDEDYSKMLHLSHEERLYEKWSKWVSEDEVVAYWKQRDATQGFDVYHFPNAYLYGNILSDRNLFHGSNFLKIVYFIAKKALENYNLGLIQEHILPPYEFSKLVMANYQRCGRTIEFYITFEVFRHKNEESFVTLEKSTYLESSVTNVYSETFLARGRYGVKSSIKVYFCRPKYVLPHIVDATNDRYFVDRTNDLYAQICDPNQMWFDVIPETLPENNLPCIEYMNIAALCVDYYNKTKNTDCMLKRFIKANHRADSAHETLFITFEVGHTSAGLQTLQSIVSICSNLAPSVKMCRVKPVEPVGIHHQFPKEYKLSSPFDGNIDFV